ncbi:MAG: protein-export chaperone SecB [Pseudomonadota bacterium]|nr:protein-export chaperone SecB [Pseudomonadota bacterium]
MASQPSTQPQFEIQKVYLKDVSFEAPNSPQMFTQGWRPGTKVQLSTALIRLNEDIHEVALSITVTATVGEKTAYLVEVTQAGIFSIKGFADAQMNQLLGAYCPSILFPFAREAIAELIAKGGFPQLLLAPINFDAVYAQQQRSEQAADSGAKH